MDGGTRNDEIDEMGGRKEVEHEVNWARGWEDEVISKNGKLTPGIAKQSEMGQECWFQAQ